MLVWTELVCLTCPVGMKGRVGLYISLYPAKISGWLVLGTLPNVPVIILLERFSLQMVVALT